MRINRQILNVGRILAFLGVMLIVSSGNEVAAQGGRESLLEREQRSANPTTQQIRKDFGYHGPADDSVIREAAGYGPTGPLTAEQQGYLDANKKAMQGPSAISPESESPRSGTIQISAEEEAEVERMMRRRGGRPDEYSGQSGNSEEFVIPAAVVSGLAVLGLGYFFVKKWRASRQEKSYASPSTTAPASDTWSMSADEFMRMGEKEEFYARWSHRPKAEIDRLWAEQQRTQHAGKPMTSESDPYA